MFGKFIFEQLDNALLNGSILPYEVYKGCLRMDGQTMVNLEIFSNNVDGGTSGKLIMLLAVVKWAGWVTGQNQ